MHNETEMESFEGFSPYRRNARARLCLPESDSNASIATGRETGRRELLGRGRPKSGASHSGPVRSSNFVAVEIGGWGYRAKAPWRGHQFSTTWRAGPARSSRARAREMKCIFFEGGNLTGQLRSVRNSADRKRSNESFQSVSRISEFPAKFPKGESPALSCEEQSR